MADSSENPWEIVVELILKELRAIRELLARQVSVQAWSAGLQTDPFNPSPADSEQAAEEARSAAEAIRLLHGSAASVVGVQLTADPQSVPAPCDCSEILGSGVV